MKSLTFLRAAFLYGAVALASAVTSMAQRTVTLSVAGNQFTATGTATVVLASQGNENALGFSVTFDPAVLRFDTTASGADLGGATLNVNSSQATSGRIGIALALPSGSSFAAGNRSLVAVNFTVLAAAGSVTVGFGNQPVFREVSDPGANELTTVFTGVTITAGLTSAAPAITTQPTSQSVNAGANVTFTAAASGSPVPTFQWRKDSTNLSGKTTASLTLTGVTAADAGSYTVVASNGVGTPATSNAATLTVTSPQRSVTLSVSGAQMSGTGVATAVLASQGNENAVGFSVTFDPAVLRFDTTANGADLGGATLNVNPTQAASGRVGIALSLPAGATYAAGSRSLVALNFTVLAGASSTALGFGDAPVFREVSDTGANELPATFTALTIAATSSSTAAAPTISTQPQNVTVVAGQAATFSVVASGSPAPTYQWQKNTVAISGATAASYMIAAAAAADAASYRVVVTNSQGAVTSSAATLTVSSPPVVTSASVVTFYTGAANSFSVTASGNPAPTFTVSGGNFPSWATLNSTTGVLSGTPPNTTGSPFAFTLTASNGIAPAATQAFTLTVQAATLPTITAQPVSRSVAVGATASFTVTAVGTAPLTYQWRKNGAPISGATTATLTLSSVQTADTAAYTVVITNVAGSVTSEPATLGVIPPGTSATHAAVGSGYVAGNSVTITNTFTFTGGATSLAWRVLLPAGWSYVSGSAAQGDVKPEVGMPDLLEWAWSTPPASPLSFTYTLNVPAGQTGPKELVAVAVLRQGAAPIEMLAAPDPLVIDRVGTHAADSNRDFRISLIELTRVIELFNTRIGTMRTGAYRVQDGTEDGFTPEPTRVMGATVTLSKYHSADTRGAAVSTPPDGSLGLFELTRVIELYNARNGTVRTGAYRALAGTEDGFAVGP